MTPKRILYILLFFTLSLQAQIKDLAEMASGTIVNFQPVYNNDEKLFGYFALYDQGDKSKTIKQLEYVLLDKNLNKISSNVFETEIYYQMFSIYYAYIDINGNLIIYPDNYKSNGRIKKYKLDLKTNEFSTFYGKCFENNSFVSCEPYKFWKEEKKDYKAEKKAKGYIDQSSVRILKKGKLIVSQYKDYEKYIKDNVIMYFDENEKMIWKYDYNNFADKKNSEKLTIIDIDDKTLYGIKTVTTKKEVSFKLIALDINTGKVLADNPINVLTEETLKHFFLNNIPLNKSFDDKIILFSNNWENDNVDGYSRIIFDKKDYSIKGNVIRYKEDLQPYIPHLDKRGGVESGYYLNDISKFLLKDGSIVILTEKYKPAGQYSRNKTTDMVYIYTDKDFKVKDVKILEKQKSKGEYTDFLFSQYLDNDENVVFFYKDYQKDDESKDKNWILFINTLLKGEFKQEQILMSSKKDKFMIYPYIAKEGYILLREFNEKEKYNQIRLEKLNY